ncbi:MAG: hypothetical protein ACYTAF_05335 [Planctomycetota bacterium]
MAGIVLLVVRTSEPPRTGPSRAPAESSASNGTWEVTIRPYDVESLAVREPMLLEVTLKNVSSEELMVRQKKISNSGIRITAVAPSERKETMQRGIGGYLLGRPHSSGLWMLDLPPGKKVTSYEMLYCFDEPGTYEVRVSVVLEPEDELDCPPLSIHVRDAEENKCDTPSILAAFLQGHLLLGVLPGEFHPDTLVRRPSPRLSRYLRLSHCMYRAFAPHVFRDETVNVHALLDSYIGEYPGEPGTDLVLLAKVSVLLDENRDEPRKAALRRLKADFPERFYSIISQE